MLATPGSPPSPRVQVNWAAIYGAGVTWNYTAEQILYFSMQTGTPWADGFTALSPMGSP